nr:ABC transporter permease [Kofleriaceae bacterium]
MIRVVARRLAWTALVAWFVVTATFALLAAIPDDPMRALLGPHASEQSIAAARAHYCLDDGVVARYGCFVGDALRGDLGESYRSKRAVTDVLADRWWPTAQLAFAALALQLAIGVPLGVIAARRRGRWPDRAITIGALIAASAPAFVVGSLLLDVVAFRTGWLPLGGYGDAGVLDRLRHLALPALTLAAGGAAAYARLARAEVAAALASDHVRTARAKGAGERAVVLHHALRPGAAPLIALAGVDLGALLGGAILVEWIFQWPGLGRELLLAVLDVDLPVIIGIVLVSAIAIALANLVADVVAAWLDPRLR